MGVDEETPMISTLFKYKVIITSIKDGTKLGSGEIFKAQILLVCVDNFRNIVFEPHGGV